MSFSKRKKTYIWATWLAAALSGEKACEFSSWLKGNFTYTKVDENKDLSKWKADHARMVRDRVEKLRSEGWVVTVEGENKFTVRGKVADVGGQADIVAVRGDEIVVEDCKTGKKKDEHFWQVVIYMALLPKVDSRFMAAKRIRGTVIYPDDATRDVDGYEAEGETNRIFERIKELATAAEPPKTPSASECRFCDIADCDARLSDDSSSTTDTEAF